MFCGNCGNEIKEGVAFCPNCGTKTGEAGNVAQPQQTQQQGQVPAHQQPDGGISNRDWLTTLLLCFFLSWFGVHRFYAGKTGTGVLMILIGWLTLGIWHLVDFITICVGKFKDKEGRLIVKSRY